MDAFLANYRWLACGQATTLLMQAGIDPGLTDLIALAPAP